MKRLRLRPWTVKKGKPWCKLVNRRLPKVTGALWCVRVDAVNPVGKDEVVGVALVGNPVGAWADETLSVLRVAVIEGHRNACSMLYGACSKMARASGADNLVTYTHGNEHGGSLKAAGWIDGGLTDGGEHSRQMRLRAPAIDPLPKRRWWAPWSVRAQELST